MTTTERLEAFLAKAAASEVESIRVPTVNAKAIALRAQRLQAGPQPYGARWFALSAAAMAVIGLLFFPPVSNAIARAAHNLLAFTYFPPAHKGQKFVIGHTITLDQARAIGKIHFIEPKGLPAEYHMIWATEAPVTAARFVITLRYESSRNGAGLSFMEMAAKPGAKTLSCRVFSWSRTSTQTRPPNVPANYRGKGPPPGFTSVPCRAWRVGTTQLQLVDEHGELSESQMRRIIQSTR